MSYSLSNSTITDTDTLAKGMEKLISDLFDPHKNSQTGMEDAVTHLLQKKVGQITQDEAQIFLKEFGKIKERINDFSKEDSQKNRNMYETKIVDMDVEDEKPHYLPKDLVAKRYNLDIFQDDLYRLRPGQWLNDRLINFYVNYLTEKSDANPVPKQTTAISSLYFSILGKGGIDEKNMNFEGASEILQRRADMKLNNKPFIFDIFKRVFFVCNVENSHWVLVECRIGSLQKDTFDSMNTNYVKGLKTSQIPSSKSDLFSSGSRKVVTLIMYDSLSGSGSPDDNKVLKMVKKAVLKEFERRNQNVTSSDVQLVYGPNNRQKNFSDCGVFVCKYLELLYDKGMEDPKISEAEIDKMRKDLDVLIRTVNFKKDLPKALPL